MTIPPWGFGASAPVGADIDGDGRAEVLFVARSKLGGRAHRLQECSRFVRESGRWYYIDGT